MKADPRADAVVTGHGLDTAHVLLQIIQVFIGREPAAGRVAHWNRRLDYRLEPLHEYRYDMILRCESVQQNHCGCLVKNTRVPGYLLGLAGYDNQCCELCLDI